MINIKADKNKQLKLENQKEEEFKGRVQNYMAWRWSGVSFYQSFFVVFVTSAILILVDILVGNDLVLKVLLVIILAIASFELYKKMVQSASKPVFVAENMIATIESEPVSIKTKGGDYLGMKISMPVHNEVKLK